MDKYTVYNKDALYSPRFHFYVNVLVCLDFTHFLQGYLPGIMKIVLR